jgi:drug/metabolite transporter (DMT)-like permease
LEFILAGDVSLLTPAKERNLMLTIIFGVVGLVLSFGFPVPPELSVLRLVAPVGVMAGYQAGQLVGRFVRPRPKRFLTLFVSAIFCGYFAFAYIQTLRSGAANTSDIVNLGVLLGLSFFWLGFLLPFTRVPKELTNLWSRATERSRD